MAKPEELVKDAEKAEEKKNKPLPALVSPTVNLVVELRQAIAHRCRETGESFSLVTNKMWLTLLKKEGKVKANLEPDFSVKRVGGGMKVKLDEKDAEIAKLQEELTAARNAKK